jgi:hypothetical protein
MEGVVHPNVLVVRFRKMIFLALLVGGRAHECLHRAAWFNSPEDGKASCKAAGTGPQRITQDGSVSQLEPSTENMRP